MMERHRLLFDTNTLVDMAIVRDSELFTTLGRIVRFCRVLDVRMMTCATSLKDADWIISHNSSFKKREPDPRSRRLLTRSLRQALVKSFALCPIDEVVVRRALYLEPSEHSFDDAIISACAELNNTDFIVTSDRKAFRSSSVPRLSPEDCLKYLYSL